MYMCVRKKDVEVNHEGEGESLQERGGGRIET